MVWSAAKPSLRPSSITTAILPPGSSLNFHKLPPATSAGLKGRHREGGSGGAQTWNFPPPFISPRGNQESIRWITEIGYNKSSNRKVWEAWLCAILALDLSVGNGSTLVIPHNPPLSGPKSASTVYHGKSVCVGKLV